MESENVKRFYSKVVEYIEESLAKKKWAIGDELPSEDAIAEELHITPEATRDALRTLEALDVVEQNAGACARLTGRFSKMFADSFAMALLVDAIDFLEIARLRRTLEIEAFTLAFSLFNDESLQAVEQALVNLENSETNDAERVEFDAAFHNEIIRSAQNKLLAMLSEGLLSVYSIQIKGELSKYSQEDRQKLRKAHRDIYDALRDGDFQLGLDAIDAHYKIIESYLVGFGRS